MSKKKADVIDIKNGAPIEGTEWREIEYTCPVRGKVKQKVKVTVYKPKQVEVKDFVKSSDSMVNDFDMGEITGHLLDDDDNLNPNGEGE